MLQIYPRGPSAGEVAVSREACDPSRERTVILQWIVERLAILGSLFGEGSRAN